jgi:hypothetical protein
VFVACGSRSGLAPDEDGYWVDDKDGGRTWHEGGGSGNGGSGGAAADSGPSLRPGDPGNVTDGGLRLDGGCSAVVEQLGWAGDGIACKLSLTWTCGGVTYVTTGACGPDLDASFPGIHGACWANGENKGSLSEPTTTCSCKDLHATLTKMAKDCGFVIPSGGQ